MTLRVLCVALQGNLVIPCEYCRSYMKIRYCSGDEKLVSCKNEGKYLCHL